MATEKAATLESDADYIPFDEALIKYVGGFGKYQKLLVLLFSAITILTGMLSAEVVFVAAKPKFWCVSGKYASNHHFGNLDRNKVVWHNMTSQNNTLHGKDIDQCVEQQFNASDKTEKKCTAWAYDDSQYKSTIVTEFDLVCDKHMLVPTVKSLTLVGKIVGGLLGGFLSDRFGRRLVLLSCIVVLPLCRVIEMAVPSFTVFAIAYFVRCAFLTVLYLTFFILMAEIVQPNKRALVGTMAAAFFSVGYVVLSAAAFLVRERWLLQLVNTVPALFMLIFFFVPESPRWYYAKGRKALGLESMKKITAINNRTLPEDVTIFVPAKTKSTGNVRELFSANVIVRMMIMNVSWFTAAIVYYALTLNIDEFAGNVYLNMLIMGIVEMVGCFASQFFMTTRMGRRISATVTFFLAGAALLAILVVPPHLPLISTGLAMVGKFGIAGAYNVVYIFAAELYPTTIRGVGMSAANTFSKIGGALAPFAWKLALIHQAIPLTIFGAMSVASGIICLFLPETRGQPLPQTVEDLKKAAPEPVQFDPTLL